MSTSIEDLRRRFDEEFETISDMETWKSVRDKFLAREGGIVTAEMKKLRDLPKEERPAFGQAMNRLRSSVKKQLEQKQSELKASAVSGGGASVDVTRPGFPFALGSVHPIKHLQAEIERIFVNLGFTVFDLTEIEKDYYNFEALNIPRNHPARNDQDTFYFDDELLLRTHCTPVDVHAMERLEPPIRAVTTGKVYRRDPFDATHSPMFYQVDVVCIDEGITMGDMKGMMDAFLKQVFQRDVQMRLRPMFFPFVEPGAEVDISCIFCEGRGCPTCKQSGWIEILGAGMCHPKVLRMAGIDESRYSGFAWGMGIDRVAMLKYGIEDIRLLYENDLRFLEQF